MGNARGNAYSRGHVSLANTDSEYWKFSFDEMGKYDLPAAFDKARTKADMAPTQKLHYIGHSMGTTMFWIAAHENPGLVDQVEMMVAMGPVAKVANMISPLKYLAPWVHQVEV